MKLVTSTGDFSGYVNTVEEKIRHFKGSKFKYINLEQTGTIPEFLSDDDDGWKRLAEAWGNAGKDAGVEFLVSHSPCLNAYQELTDENYAVVVRAIRRSIEIAHVLSIPRIVVHACPHESFTAAEFYRENKRFYNDLLDLAEKYNIALLTENMDNYMHHPLSTGKELREFADYMDHPLLGVCWDIAHGNINQKAKRLGQYENITAIGDKLWGLHVSDNFGDSAHHHSWPFAGIVNFDSVMQGLLDVNYDGHFTFEASYTLLHEQNIPYHRQAWEHNGETVTRLLSPPVELKKQAVDLLYNIGEYILKTYDCFEE
ncbi:MAG: sugar phosphate isomerase/epimerase [Clostridia bacterium]|nr:sugar phosphate isomerase/epimerase [Clostridia bacterium]